jgi:hypothetical protein
LINLLVVCNEGFSPGYPTGLAIGRRLGAAAWEQDRKLENFFRTHGSFRIPDTSLGIVARGQ